MRELLTHGTDSTLAVNHMYHYLGRSIELKLLSSTWLKEAQPGYTINCLSFELLFSDSTVTQLPIFVPTFLQKCEHCVTNQETNVEKHGEALVCRELECSLL